MRALKTLLLLIWLLPASAGAQSVEDQVVAQLRDQGFSEFQVSRTLLGRLRVVALSANFRRELVLNPATGSVLRDVLRPLGSTEEGETRVVVPRSTEQATTGAAPAAPDTETEPVRGAVETREEIVETVQEAVRDAVEETREDVRDAREDVREERQDTREDRQEERDQRQEDREDRREDRQDGQ